MISGRNSGSILDDAKGLLVIAGLAVVGFLVYELYKHASLFNPASQNNLANTGFNSAYQGLTGSSGTFGGDLYSWLHPYNPNSTTQYVYQLDPTTGDYVSVPVTNGSGMLGNSGG